MNRNVVGYSRGAFGLGILTSSVIYPLSYLQSEVVFVVIFFHIGILLIR